MNKPTIYNREKAVAHMEKHGLKTKHLELWVKKFKNLRSDAKKRGTRCDLTLSQYVKLAIRAGLTRPSQIGHGSDQYNMARYGDCGRYEWGNCRFITSAENQAEKCDNGGYARQAEKMRGRTAVTDLGLKARAEKLRGRTKHNDPSRASQAKKISKSFKLYSPSGKVHIGRNLKEFAEANGLTPQKLGAVCRGEQSHHKGWTGGYAE